MSAWPQTREELIEEQLRLGALAPPPWRLGPGARVGAVFVCFVRGGSGPGNAGDAAWAAAAVGDEDVVLFRKGRGGLQQVRTISGAHFVRLQGRYGFG